MDSFDSPEPAIERFPTDNIKLAAILRTMGFALCDGMPAEIDLHAQTGQRRKRFWFDTQIDWNGATHKACLIEHWYASKGEFEAKYPDHPVTWMREALDAREWLIKVKFKEAHLKGEVGGCKTYPTSDWQFGACLIAARYRLLKMDGAMLYFFDDGKCHVQLSQFNRPLDPEDVASRLPIAWRREALRNRQHLHDLLQHSGIVPQVHTKIHDKHVLLPASASRELKHRIFSL